MGTAFEITEEDVGTVLQGMGLPADEAAELFDRLDADAVEKAALYGNDMDEQTGYAHDEIRRQLAGMGVAPARPMR